MAPRLNKRQAREEAEAAELLAQATALDSAEESENDELPAAMGGFQAVSPALLTVDSRSPARHAQLNAEAPEEEEDEPEEVIQEKVNSTSLDFSARQLMPSHSQSKKPKSKKKKNKAAKAAESTESRTPTKSAKPTKAAAKQEEELDEFDRALAELALQDQLAGKPAPVSQPTPSSDSKFNKLKEIYSFDLKFLDADAELRRMFGSKVIATTATAPRSNQHARFANNIHHPTSLRRTASVLINPEPGWVPLAANRGGISIARYEGSESKRSDGEWWTIVHSQTYKEGQLGFLEVLQQADGNRLYDILESHPYSVDTLMQLSEMAAQQGDLGACMSAFLRSHDLPSRCRRLINASFQSTLRPLRRHARFLSLRLLPTAVLPDREPRLLSRCCSQGVDTGEARNLEDSLRMVQDCAGSCR